MISASDITAGLSNIQSTDNLTDLDALRVFWLGKNGLITKEFKQMSTLSKEQKADLAKVLNDYKCKILEAIAAHKNTLLDRAIDQELSKSKDVSLPARRMCIGRIHPITQVINKLYHFFELRGFTSFSHDHNCELESEDNNFTFLNIPENHPARSMQDTFFIKDKVLRTHVSASQPRILKSVEPPIKAVVFGRVYRSDQPDATHVPVFHQMECLYVDNTCSFSHLKDTIDAFITYIFGEKMKIRYRSSYFPFTVPSVEIDVWLPQEKKWLEILGAGMVHPEVLRKAGHDPDKLRGFAFGVGIERLAMIYFGLSDVRQLYGADLDLLAGCNLWQ